MKILRKIFSPKVHKLVAKLSKLPIIESAVVNKYFHSKYRRFGPEFISVETDQLPKTHCKENLTANEAFKFINEICGVHPINYNEFFENSNNFSTDAGDCYAHTYTHQIYNTVYDINMEVYRVGKESYSICWSNIVNQFYD